MYVSKTEVPTGLSAILYGLYHIEKVEEDGSYKNLSGYLDRNYDEEEIEEYKQALDWSANNPDFDFNSVLPDLIYTNDEIVMYLKKFRQFSKIFESE